MGCDVALQSPAAREIFERAVSVLGYDLLDLQANGPAEKLRETEYSQPAIFTTNVALYVAVGDILQPVVGAGHSFAEFCSLVVSKSLAFEEALRIVHERAQAMQEAARQARGGMSAILGLEAAQIRSIIEQLKRRNGAPLTLANFNSPTQIVISGALDAMQAAGDAMLAAGAKRVVPLNVSGAWHSALMEPALKRFTDAVEAGHFRLPVFDVISNVDARPYRDVASIKANLIRSLVSEVRWHDAAECLLSYRLDLVIEFGASGVLGAMMRRMQGAPAVSIVSDHASVENVRAAIGAGV
jgi:[acyl-carrier-protein] S-malonyltransferase